MNAAKRFAGAASCPSFVGTLLLLIVFLIGAGAAKAQTVTDTCTVSWTAPPGVTSVTVEAWGGGGGGGGATGNPAKGGGGAGGQYARKAVTVIPGTVYPCTVGTGGAVSAGNGNAGGSSTFGGATVVAQGGAGGALCATNGCTAAGGSGSTAGGAGDIVYAGGSGSSGVGSTGVGGAGGGGAGSTGPGGNASGNTAGTGTANGGGNGAAARTTAGNCTNAASVAGGGGCGGYARSGADRTGGAGAAGKVTITYVPVPAPAATTNAASGITPYVATLNGTVSSNGTSTTVAFQYGLTVAYGNSITATQSPLASNASNVPVSVDLIGLNCNTTFHYRVVATNSGGSTYGLDRTFTTGACLAPFPPTACAAARFGSDLGCTASDVNITAITLAPGSMSSCVAGTPITVDLDMIVNFASPDRFDIGIFIANDGKSAQLHPSNGGANSCSVDILPITKPPSGDIFLDLDGVPQGTADICGDGNSSFVPLPPTPTGAGVKRMTGVTLPCFATPASGGRLYVPFVVSWDNQKSPIGGLCTSNRYPVPNTAAKCNAPASTVAIDVVVLPTISKTNGGSTVAPGASTTYSVVITNNSGGTLQDSVFKDPAVADLTVNSVTCTSAAGASCPTTSVAAMQNAGILIPSASLPNNSSLTFTINATLSSSAILGNHLINTATVAIGSNTNSASDDDLIALAASASMSFAPNTITEGAASMLTIAFTNPTSSAVTGVSFTDTYPSGLVNTASASVATTCGGTVIAADNGNSVALSGATIPASGSCTVTVNVSSATAASYVNSTGTITTDIGPLSAASATLTVNAPAFGAFNACDPAPAPNANCTSTTTVATSHITTKIAGLAFSLDLVALGSDGTRNTNYSNNIRVELLDASNNGSPLDSNNCRSTWTVIATLSPNPAFSNADNGLITAGPFTVAEAYREVRARISNVGGTTRTGCSTDNFAVRPDRLMLSATDNTWQTAGTARTINNTDAPNPGSQSGTPFPIHKAGQPFTVTATAVNASGVTTTNYSVASNPTLVLGDCGASAACPDLANLGTLTLGSPASASGVITWNSAIYTEVGSFSLDMRDTDFAAVDAADTAADCTSSPHRYVCTTTSTSVGRFVPDHFDLSGGAIVNRSDVNSGAGCSPASSFTYMGEPMKAGFTLIARNAGGNTTRNYAGSLAKFSNTIPSWTGDTGNDRVGLWMMGQNHSVSPGTCKVLFSNATPSVTSYACTGVGNPPSINRAAGPRVTLSSPPDTLSWTNGAATFGAHAVLERSDVRDGSYNTINIGVAPVDADGVTVQASALNLDADNSGTNERVSLGTTSSRFGVLKLDNAYGSELLSLRLPVRALYWNGSAFVTNPDDSCTSISPSNIAIGNYRGSLNAGNLGSGHLPGSAVTLNSGSGTITVTKPSPSAVGSVDLSINLGATSGDANCIGGGFPAAAGSNLSWLRGNWCAATYSMDPNARLSFGTSRSPFIYLREMY